ncbi:unnamed protein product [Paramecium sonneborni]|uniref:Uncharacterized protein n=1 Tax=Paramecium sonneborni TaxID=65129 RepID=A0A8S1NYC1_9CILI|nr:unnamed protein product [Paramecium sonneborni]
MIQINQNKIKMNLIKKTSNLKIQTNNLPINSQTQINAYQFSDEKDEINSPEVRKFETLLFESLTKTQRLSEKFKLFQPLIINEQLKSHSKRNQKDQQIIEL